MAADEHLGAQFEYTGTQKWMFPGGHGGEWHTVVAKIGDEEVGDMLWNAERIGGLGVQEEHRRKGIATGLWNKAKEVAKQNKDIPKPRHSPERTDAGDAWARKVGGKLPPRVPVEENW